MQTLLDVCNTNNALGVYSICMASSQKIKPLSISNSEKKN